MLLKKNIILVVLVALMSIGCGTDGLDAEQEQLSFTNSGAFFDALSPSEDVSGIPAEQEFTFTFELEGNQASNVNLTSFTENGDWLSAQLIDDGGGIEVIGTPPLPPSDEDSHTFGYSLIAVGSDEGNAELTFEVEAYSNSQAN
jgi:hypothetical protein